ncbi:MAG: malate--CoA ligase subunit beta [Arenicellales bacterium]
MDIHEYQAKELLSEFGVAVPPGGLAYSPEQAQYRAQEIGGDRWVVKAQVHSGARGKAGGIVVCRDDREVYEAAAGLLGKQLVTEQTAPAGKGVYRLYIEEATDIEREMYLGFVLDRARERVMAVASRQGGMSVEELATHHPEALIRIEVEPAVGMQKFQARQLAFYLGVPESQLNAAVSIILGCYRLFRNYDASMVEINPLALTRSKQLVALDAKISFDDNALFRHTRIAELRDKSQEDRRERKASDRGLSYVGLDGNIGCIINGAGLAMATLDMIKLAGGEPANFLDIGGGASPDRVTNAFELVLVDEAVQVVLVNIFAGINRCDWVAEGVVQAIRSLEVEVPVVVRLSGTNVDEGRRIIQDSGLPIELTQTLAEAAQAAVRRAEGPGPLQP